MTSLDDLSEERSYVVIVSLTGARCLLLVLSPLCLVLFISRQQNYSYTQSCFVRKKYLYLANETITPPETIAALLSPFDDPFWKPLSDLWRRLPAPLVLQTCYSVAFCLRLVGNEGSHVLFVTA